MAADPIDDVAETPLVESSAAGIRVRDLGMTFETGDGLEEVFADIDIDIEPGEFVCLLGKSGSGKSTLLNIISGILEPTAGEVTFVTQDPDEEVRLGHVFQSPRLLPWNTLIGNIEYVHEHNPEYTDDLARRHLDLVGLSEHYNKFPTQLSGGQQQRVGIARALSIDPGVLLMDEPFSNLDEITAETLREQLLELWQRLGKTVFFVTHDITEAIQLGDRLLMLGQGRLYGDLDNPLDRPRKIDTEEFLRFRQRAIEDFHSIDE